MCGMVPGHVRALGEMENGGRRDEAFNFGRAHVGDGTEGPGIRIGAGRALGGWDLPVLIGRALPIRSCLSSITTTMDNRPPLIRSVTAPPPSSASLAHTVDSATIDSFPTPPSHTQNTAQPWLLRPLAAPVPPLPPSERRSPHPVPPPLLLRKRSSAHSLAPVPPPMPTADLPPLPAHALAVHRPAPPSPIPSRSLSRPSSNSSLATAAAAARKHGAPPAPAPTSALPLPPTPVSASSWHSRGPSPVPSPGPSPAQSPTSPSLPVPSSPSIASLDGRTSSPMRAPRKAASHSIMRPARTHARPSTAEGLLHSISADAEDHHQRDGGGVYGHAPAHGQGVGQLPLAPPWEHQGPARRGTNGPGQGQGHSRASPAASPAVHPRSPNAPYMNGGTYSASATPPAAATSTMRLGANTNANTQVLEMTTQDEEDRERERATTPRPLGRAPRKTGPSEEVTPWEVHGETLTAVDNRTERNGRGEVDGEDEDREYGVSTPMEFGRAMSTAQSSMTSSYAGSTRSRASSATGPVDEVTPWEVQAAGGGVGGRSKIIVAQSIRSRASSNVLSAATGPIEEVTPWELHGALPASSGASVLSYGTTTSAQYTGSTNNGSGGNGSLHTPRTPTTPATTRSGGTGAGAQSIRSRASSSALALGNASVATGPVEEVTPWEVQVPLSTSSSMSADDASYGVSRPVPIDGATHVGLPLSQSVAGRSSAATATASAANPGAPSVRSGRSGTMNSAGSAGVGAVEEVTPWEVQAGPGETVYGVTREVAPPLPSYTQSAGLEAPGERRRSGASGISGVSVGVMEGSAVGGGGNTNNRPPSVRSGRSRASSAVHSPTTPGSVDEVTPWELYPAPPVPVQQQQAPQVKEAQQQPMGKRAKVLAKLRGKTGSGSAPTDTATGANLSTYSDGKAQGATVGSITSSGGGGGGGGGSSIYARSVKSMQTHRSTATGAVEDVLPWEVQDMPASPPLPSHVPAYQSMAVENEYQKPQSVPHRKGTIDSAGAYVRAPSDKPQPGVPTAASSPPRISVSQPGMRPPLTGPVEEVMPWETEAAPPVPSLGLQPGNAGRVRAVSQNQAEHLRAQRQYHEQMLGDVRRGAEAGAGAGQRVRASSDVDGGAGGGRAGRGSMTLEQLSEVMPWELEPAPSAVAVSQPGQRAHDPALGLAAPNGSGIGPGLGTATITSMSSASSGSISHSGASASAHVAQVLADFTHFGMRRRRSTGANGAEGPNFTSTSGSGGMGHAMSAGTLDGGKRKSYKLARMSTSGVASSQAVSSADINARARAHSPTEAYPGPHPASNGAPASASATSVSGSSKAKAGGADDRFSTADRTILEELKAGLRAREAQFVLKGVGETVLGGGRGVGKKHHVHPKEEVPYPRAYGRDVIDLDVWETLFMMDACKSLSWHVFETPPVKVLEIGCGTGTWVLHCARVWKDTHFVGLDIVPLHPDLQTVGSPDLASRITWVQHNFLDGLPFQNEEFDFVHMKRVALGVPENKWDPFFEEVARVMKPGGRLEMIEEDLFFPGKPVDNDDDDKTLYGIHDDTESMITRQDSTASNRRRSYIVGGEDVPTLRLEDVPEKAEPSGVPTHSPTDTSADGSSGNRAGADTVGSPGANARTNTNTSSASRASSPVRSARASGKGHGRSGGSYDANDPHSLATLKVLGAGGSRHHIPSLAPVPPSLHSTTSSAPSYAGSVGNGTLFTPHSRSSHRPSLHTAHGQGNMDMLYASAGSLVSSIGYMAYQDPLADSIKKQRKLEAVAKKMNASVQGTRRTRPSPVLSSLMNRGPVNPRDHTVLQAVWEGMLEGRFVNSSPLSLLTTYLEYHFTDVRTHPPIMYTFPPTPPSLPRTEDDEEGLPVRMKFPREPEMEFDTVAEQPKPQFVNPWPVQNGAPPVQDERWLPIQMLMRGKSPYVSFDGLRGYAYSPSKQSTFRRDSAAAASSAEKEKEEGEKESHSKNSLSVSTVRAGEVPGSRMPNTSLHIDLNTLNLHLTMRAKEIVGCSESMWEWIEEFQASPEGKAAQEAMASGQAGRGLIVPSHMGGMATNDETTDADASRAIILDLTRDDFDRILNNFEWDMLDKASLGHALQMNFRWNTFEGPLLAHRQVFNEACAKHASYLLKKHKQALQANSEPDQNAAASLQSNTNNSVSTPGFVRPSPDTADSVQNQIARSQSSLQPAYAPIPAADDEDLLRSQSWDEGFVETRKMTPEQKAQKAKDDAEAIAYVDSIATPPTQMLSRSIRVFVAWKPLAPATSPA